VADHRLSVTGAAAGTPEQIALVVLPAEAAVAVGAAVISVVFTVVGENHGCIRKHLAQAIFWSDVFESMQEEKSCRE
jgi:hypothetical protein